MRAHLKLPENVRLIRWKCVSDKCSQRPRKIRAIVAFHIVRSPSRHTSLQRDESVSEEKKQSFFCCCSFLVAICYRSNGWLIGRARAATVRLHTCARSRVRERRQPNGQREKDDLMHVCMNAIALDGTIDVIVTVAHRLIHARETVSFSIFFFRFAFFLQVACCHSAANSKSGLK